MQDKNELRRGSCYNCSMLESQNRLLFCLYLQPSFQTLRVFKALNERRKKYLNHYISSNFLFVVDESMHLIIPLKEWSVWSLILEFSSFLLPSSAWFRHFSLFFSTWCEFRMRVDYILNKNDKYYALDAS